MPTYRYRCTKCGDEIEEWQSFSDKPLSKHSGCGGKLVKVLSTPGIVLKGSGFYRTDNRNGGATTPSKQGPERTSTSGSTSGSGSGSGSHDSSGTSSSGDSSSGESSSGESKATPKKPEPTGSAAG